MLAELRHVIENNPTCLYEDDYDDFKKSGLLNPTKKQLKVSPLKTLENANPEKPRP